MTRTTDRSGTHLETLGLKAPVEWFEQLDAWREKQDFVPKPSRPAAIRWIVWTFLQKQQQQARTKRRRSK